MKEWEQSLQDELEEVRQVYVKALTERLKQLNEAAEEYLSRPKNIETKNNLMTIVHRLRGSAGSFGFYGISRAAEELEEWLEMLSQSPFDDPAKAEKFQLAVEAFGSGSAYNQWVFATGLPDDIRLKLLYAGEGTFWTDLKGFSETLLGRQAQQEREKQVRE